MNEYEAHMDINGPTSQLRISHLVKVNFTPLHPAQKHNEKADSSLMGHKFIFCIPVVVPSSDDNLILAAIQQTKQVKA